MIFQLLVNWLRWVARRVSAVKMIVKRTNFGDAERVEHADGSVGWYLHDKPHRKGGPALTFPDGKEIWCIDGGYHRIGGPAILGGNAMTTWWINNAKVDSKEYQSYTGCSNEELLVLILKYGKF